MKTTAWHLGIVAFVGLASASVLGCGDASKSAPPPATPANAASAAPADSAAGSAPADAPKPSGGW